MPAVVLSTELSHDMTPTTARSAPRPSTHEFEDKSQETTKDANAAITSGSVFDYPPPAQLQSQLESGSISRIANIEDVPVENDPRQWSQRRKVGDKAIQSVTPLLMTATARNTRYCCLCRPRPHHRRFHLST